MIVASLLCSLDRMLLIVLASCSALFGLDLVLLFFFFCSVFIHSATICLYMSWSDVGSFCIALSASNARSQIQFFCLVCKLYFRPFCSRVISHLENGMSCVVYYPWVKTVFLLWVCCLGLDQFVEFFV